MKNKTYPDWYIKRENVFNETRPELFVGRKFVLDSYWMNLIHTNAFIENVALISQRKMGKTALLKRFCNVLYSSQTEVVPFFYTFSQEEIKQKLLIDKVSDDMMLTFMKQFAAFLFKNTDFFKMRNKKHFLDKIHTIDHPIARLIEKEFEYYDDDVKKEIGQYKIQRVFDSVLSVVDHANMRCMMVIDEVQEMDLSIYDENDNLIHGSSALTRVYQLLNIIWLIVTGSKVSCITNQVIVDAMRNRISVEGFYPLDESETSEYVTRLLEFLQQKGYNEIFQDVFNLTGGNPYYIQKLFFSSHLYLKIKNKKKTFSSFEELMEIFNFEVRDPNGSLYNYWNIHFRNNTDNLNCDADKPGITAKILHHIATRSTELEKEEKELKAKGKTQISPFQQRIPFSEIAKKLNIDIELVEAKVKQLVEADFVDANMHGRWVIRISDRILPVYLVDHYYEKILSKPTKDASEQEIKNILQNFKELQSEQYNTKKRISKIEKMQEKTNKNVKSNRARISNLKGKEGEEKIKDAIKNGIGIFKNYKKQIATKIFVPDKNGDMFDIDLFVGNTNTKGKKKIEPLAIEVKNHATKVYIKEVKHFINALNALKSDQKLKTVKAYFISYKGVSKTGKELLEKNNIESLLFSEVV